MIVKFDKAPTANDTLLFDLETTSGGMLENPISIDRIIIYHIEIKPGRTPNDYTLSKPQYNPAIQNEFKKMQQSCQQKPDETAIKTLQALKQKLEASAVTNTFYFNEALPVMVLGNRDKVAWTKETIDSPVKQVVDIDGQPIRGRFTFHWDASGNRDGTYVIVWEWRTENEFLQAHKNFQIHSDKKPLTADETYYTPEDKYKMLADLYTPSMYKSKITSTDETPKVVEKLNESVAEGFTMLEDLANQLGGMLDANLAHKSVLPLLGSMLGLKLRSDNPNRWRSQIKRAVQLHKRKGTMNGLYEALSQAGIRLTKLTKLWQVVSNYTITDNFVIGREGRLTPTVGKLTKMPFKVDEIKLKGSDGEFIDIPPEYIIISPPMEPTDQPTLIWQGYSLDPPIDLFPGDVLLITYRTQEIPADRRAIEDYIQSLPLSDDRPDTTPTKNWNVRLIEDDDALFDVIVPNRFPIMASQPFGKVRTRFLYSEQVFNMDTYNGSLRDSFVPCDLDRTFVDRCSACQSSQFNVDLEIENLSDERVTEAREIIKDYSPFHARLHSINIAGAVNEFLLPPQEDIQCLVQAGVTQPVTIVNQSEVIDYEIEWKDGSKEKNKVKT